MCIQSKLFNNMVKYLNFDSFGSQKWPKNLEEEGEEEEEKEEEKKEGDEVIFNAMSAYLESNPGPFIHAETRPWLSGACFDVQTLSIINT